MKKRTFLKVAGATSAQAILAPWLGARARGNVPEKLKNWAGNIDYSTENLYAARSVAEVSSYVSGHSKLKVLGTRHCFNTIADSRYGFLSLLLRLRGRRDPLSVSLSAVEEPDPVGHHFGDFSALTVLRLVRPDLEPALDRDQSALIQVPACLLGQLAPRSDRHEVLFAGTRARTPRGGSDPRRPRSGRDQVPRVLGRSESTTSTRP